MTSEGIKESRITEILTDALQALATEVGSMHDDVLSHEAAQDRYEN